MGLAGLLLGTGACADDGVGGSGGTASSSSGGASSGTAGTSSTGPGATSMATGADTTAGVASTSGTTTAGTSSGSPTTTTDTSGGSASSGDGSTTDTGSGSGSSSGGNQVCGNGAVELGEQCDSGDFQGFDCVSLGFGPGLLFCDPVACTFDTSNCSVPGNCGNGTADAGEQCDGADLQGFDCASLGLGGGTLLCDPATCVFDLSMCGGVGNCGNGLVDPGEQCDGANLQGFDCVSLGLAGGTLACDPITCTFDTSMCMAGGGTSG